MNATMWQASKLIAHHLVRTSFGFTSAYPGSPTTLITDELEALARRGLTTFRYATNEKVALEMAGGVALSGGRAAVVMKHVGLNVALDAAMGLAYTGVRAPLLLIVGDDPQCESSSTEQDSRLLARFLSVPCFEPSSIDDIPDTLDRATRCSQEVGTLVLVRLTTSICYSSSLVAYPQATAAVAPDVLAPPRGHRPFILLPAISRENRVAALERLRRVEPYAATHEVAGSGGPALLVQNSAYEPVRRALARIGASPPLLRTSLAWPLAADAVVPFLARHERVIVVEELEPMLEEQAIVLAHRRGLATRIEGSRLFPRTGALDEERALAVLAHVYGQPEQPPLGAAARLSLHARPPTFCAGCPHTTFFYSLKHVIDSLPERPFIASDIGCYTLGTKPGIEIGDVVLCMGAGVSVAAAVALTGTPAMALIGDSTFLHAGLPALANAVNQRAKLLLCILDNGHAAMTGGPAVPAGTDLAVIARGLGVASAETVDPFDTAALQATLRSFLDSDGVSVLVAKSPCALTIPAKRRRPRVDLDACTGCGDCVTKIHCPAISLDGNRKFQVNTATCVGCGFCSTICPEHALTPEPLP